MVPQGSPLIPMRPLSAGEILDGTITVYRANFRTFLTLGAILQIPGLLPSLFMAGMIPILEGGGEPSVAQSVALGLGFFGMFSVALVFYMLARPILNGAMVHAAAGVFYGDRPRVRESLRAGWRNGIPLVITALLLGLIALVAFPVLVIAGLLVLAVFTLPAGYLALFVYTFFYPQVILFENKGYMEALSRSYRLARGHFWRLLGIAVVVSLGTAILGSTLVTPVMLLPIFLPQDGFWLFFVLQTVVSAVVSILLAPLPAIAGTLAYLDLRMRKEGLDIWLGAERLAALRPASAGGSTP